VYDCVNYHYVKITAFWDAVLCSLVDVYRLCTTEDGTSNRISWLSCKISFIWLVEDLGDMQKAEKPTRQPKLSSLHNSNPKAALRFWIKVLPIIIISVILEVEVTQFYSRFASFSIHSKLLLWFSLKASGKLIYHSRGNRISSLPFIIISFIGITFSISCFALGSYRSSKRGRVGRNGSKNSCHVNSIDFDIFIFSVTLSYSGFSEKYVINSV
jgi:hypothetical protein